MKKLITILGPTATGKTKLAARLAYETGGEVISADSRQVYRGMDIGTGKDLEDYTVNGQIIPYHLIDIKEPGYEYSVFEFQKDFMTAYRDISARDKQPVLCGGTGLYLEAVLRGYTLREVPENKTLREQLKEKSHEELIEILKKSGPLHNTTDLTDRQRTLRAIEIREFEKKNPQQNLFPPVPSFVFGIRFDRQTIKKRITQRLDKRLKNGMIEEVERLLESGLKPEQLTFYGLEYRYVTLYVTGKIDYQTLFDRLNISIRQFAKRQMTWFRRMEKRGTEIRWIDGNLPDEEKVQLILHTVRNE